MSGFPVRMLRSFLGPKLKDTRPVENAQLETGAKRLNLLEHVAVGSGLIVPRASLVASWNDTLETFQILHQEEAWNVDHKQAHPVLERGAVGVYSYTFASTYQHVAGVTRDFEPIAARGSPVQTGIKSEYIITGNVVEVFLFQQPTPEDVTFVDCRFWLEVL